MSEVLKLPQLRELREEIAQLQKLGFALQKSMLALDAKVDRLTALYEALAAARGEG